MKIYSAQLKGTTTVSTGSNVSLTGSFSGSIYGFDDTIQYSSSVSSDLSNLESKSASVDISISNINQYTESNDTKWTTLTNVTSSLIAATGSYATTGSNQFFGTQTFSGSVYIANDLIVQGSSSIQYISASSVSIGTNIVQLNTATPSIRYAGLAVQDSGSSAGVTGSILWDSLCNRWIYSNPSTIGYSGGMLLSGPRTSTLGTESPLTCNYIAKSGGGDHLYDSCIIDDGTTTCIKNNLIGTGTGIFSSDFSSYGTFGSFGQLSITGITDTNKRLSIGYNTSTNTAFIQSMQNGTAYTPLLLNSTGGNVGIGTTTPGYRLEICGDGDGTGELAVKGTGTDIGLALNNTGTGGKAWRILSTGGGSGAGNGKLITWDGTGYGWVIDCSRNMGIGTTSPVATLHVGGTTGDRAIFICSSCKTSNPAYLRLIGVNSNDATTQFQIVHRGNHSNVGYTDRIDFGVNNGSLWCERVIRLDFNGNVGMCEGSLSVAGGVKFSGGSSTLSYYEEGGWYPQLYWSAGGVYNMSGINCGRYTRVGNTVDLQFQLQWGSYNGGASGGTLRVGPVPFANNGGSRAAGSVTAIASNSLALDTGYTWLGLTIDPGANFIYLIQNASAGGYSHVPQVGASGTVYSLSITYSV
jgi:hypothetical protein